MANTANRIIKVPSIGVYEAIYGFAYATVGAVGGFLAGVGLSALTQTVTGGPVTMVALATSPLSIVFTFGVASLGFFYGLAESMAPN